MRTVSTHHAATLADNASRNAVNRQLEHQRIRVVHCIGTLELGGEQSYLAQVAARLDPDRFDQAVAFTGADEGAVVTLPPYVRRIRVLDRKFRGSRPGQWPAIVTYVRALHREAPDIVATHSPGIWQLAASLTGQALRKPVVHTIQRPYGNRSRTEDIIIHSALLRQLTYSLTDRFVALGGYYAQDQIHRWGIPRDRIITNYIGIDLDDHRPDARLRSEGRRELGITDDAAVLGVVARLVPIKGVDRGLQVFAALAKYDQSARFVVVGDGPSRRDLEELARGLQVRERVIFTGARTDTSRCLNAFDVFLQTTKNPLNGISSIEAMACGKPILTLIESEEDKAMAADTCSDDNGLFISLEDVEPTAPRLSALLRDSETIHRMGNRSRELAQTHFDIRKHVHRLEELYVQLVRASEDRSDRHATSSIAGSRPRTNSVPSGSGGDEANDRLEKATALFSVPKIYLRNDAHILMRMRAARELVPSASGLTILDVGCGDGRVSLQFLSDRPESITLVDIAEPMLALARKRIPPQPGARVALMNSSLDAFVPTEHQRFNLVLCVGVIAHVPDVRQAISKLASLLAPGGRLLLQITDHEEPMGHVMDLFFRMKKRLRDVSGYDVHRTTSSEVLRLCADFGLQSRAVRQYWVLPPLLGQLPVAWGRSLLNAIYDAPFLARAGAEKMLLLERPG